MIMSLANVGRIVGCMEFTETAVSQSNDSGKESPIVTTASLAHYEVLMKTRIRAGRLAIPLLIALASAALAIEPTALPTNTVRVAAAQAARRVIDFHFNANDALAAVEKNLDELER